MSHSVRHLQLFFLLVSFFQKIFRLIEMRSYFYHPLWLYGDDVSHELRGSENKLMVDNNFREVFGEHGAGVYFNV